MRRRLRILVGLMAWGGGLVGIGWLANNQADKALGQRVAPQLWQYASGSRSSVPLEISDQLDLRGGDPIFLFPKDGRLVQIGEIRYTAGQETPTALLYSSAPTPTSTDQLAWYSSPNSMAWIVSTLMPEAKQQQVSAQIRQAVEAHHESLLQALQPLATKSLDRSLEIVESELPAAIQAHRAEFDRIGNRYQRQLIDKEVLPLVRREIWPIVRRRAKPIADRIGSDLWSRVSLWRFTWRFFYDKTPLLPNRGKFRDEFDRFVDKEAPRPGRALERNRQGGRTGDPRRGGSPRGPAGGATQRLQAAQRPRASQPALENRPSHGRRQPEVPPGAEGHLDGRRGPYPAGSGQPTIRTDRATDRRIADRNTRDGDHSRVRPGAATPGPGKGPSLAGTRICCRHSVDTAASAQTAADGRARPSPRETPLPGPPRWTR